MHIFLITFTCLPPQLWLNLAFNDSETLVNVTYIITHIIFIPDQQGPISQNC